MRRLDASPNNSVSTTRTSRSSSCNSSRSSLRFSLQSIQEEKDLYGQHLSSFFVASNVLHGAIDKAAAAAARHREGGALVVDLSQATTAAKECNQRDVYHHDEFLDLLEQQIDRVTQTIASQLKDQELSAKALLSNIDDIFIRMNNYESGGGGGASSSVSQLQMETEEATQYLRAKVQELCDLSLKLQLFVHQNADLLRQVALRADAEIGTSCTSYVNRRLAVSPWKEGPNNSALVVVLSDIYDSIRKLEAKNNKAKDDGSSCSTSKKWVAPSTFERRTTKYWVKEDKLTELLLAAVAEAPLLVYGKSGRLTSNQTRRAGDSTLSSWDSSSLLVTSTPISSVYFDSPSTMCMYKERILRSEGAQLFRIRWYGAGNKPPQGDEPVYLELKTHHESWIVEKSVKERVVIQEKDVARFLSFKNWTLDVAKELVLGASPASLLSGDKLDRQVELLQKMHHLVITKELRPCVRTMYNRTAFQSPESNKVRLTLDCNVTLMDEMQAPPGAWCLPRDAVITTDMISHVPYPVFEVKLYSSSEEKLLPSSLFQHLIDNGTLIEARKFSKFLTGAASFASRIDIVLPYWAEDQAFRELIETLVVIPGADLEALTFVGDRLLALGEGQNSLALYELGWVGSSSTLVVKQQWELETTAKSFTGEGLVYIPDPQNASGGALYVAGDNFDPASPQARGVVYIYDVPIISVGASETTTSKIQRKGILNSNMLNMDLIDTTTGTQLDSKIGDLHYFDGILYVLHDNAEVIRAWDVTSGDLLATMRLPRVSKKFSKRQWEGMALEHITASDPTSGIVPSLRGAAATAESPSPTSTLVLHLALDTPPQVWSFSVTTSPTSRGSIVFPSCAAAY